MSQLSTDEVDADLSRFDYVRVAAKQRMKFQSSGKGKTRIARIWEDQAPEAGAFRRKPKSSSKRGGQRARVQECTADAANRTEIKTSEYLFAKPTVQSGRVAWALEGSYTQHCDMFER